MGNIAKFAIAKSDQLNSDDIIGKPITIEISEVIVKGGEQPVSIKYKGDNGKPWKPCKSMIKLLIAIWGDEESEYVGRKLTLYNDETVKWAGEEIGGIRISHMSNIDSEKKVALLISKGRKTIYKVKPLIKAQKVALTDSEFDGFKCEIDNASTMADMQKIADKIKAGNYNDESRVKLTDVYKTKIDEIRAGN